MFCMKTSSVKLDLLSIAERISDKATYAEAMYELYVCMKIAEGKEAADNGQTLTHEQVKQKFTTQ